MTVSVTTLKYFFILCGLAVVLSLAFSFPVFADTMSGDGTTEGSAEVLVYLGPTFAGQMAHAYVDFIAFIVSLYLVLKLGGGRLRYPVLALGLTFLVSAVIPAVLGHQYMWIDGIIKSVGGTLALVWLLGILGLLGGQPAAASEPAPQGSPRPANQ